MRMQPALGLGPSAEELVTSLAKHRVLVVNRNFVRVGASGSASMKKVRPTSAPALGKIDHGPRGRSRLSKPRAGRAPAEGGGRRGLG